MFSFMNPLAVEIWICIIIAYVLVSFTIWIVARFSPFEWHITKASNYDSHSDDHNHSCPFEQNANEKESADTKKSTKIEGNKNSCLKSKKC